jgi:hypothetical protein
VGASAPTLRDNEIPLLSATNEPASPQQTRRGVSTPHELPRAQALHSTVGPLHDGEDWPVDHQSNPSLHPLRPLRRPTGHPPTPLALAKGWGPPTATESNQTHPAAVLNDRSEPEPLKDTYMRRQLPSPSFCHSTLIGPCLIGVESGASQGHLALRLAKSHRASLCRWGHHSTVQK